MRVAFFGSPAYAVPTLDRLVEEHDVRLVVAQPDAPAGRGMTKRRPAVALRADALDLPLQQPDRLRKNTAFAATLEAMALDVAITVAYGKILPSSLLAIPRHGFLNAHASLLPKLRGAAPIQWALMRGEERTGVTIMQTEAGLDTGPIRLVHEEPIHPDDTAASLSDRLSRASADAVSEALRLLERGALPSEPQVEAEATLAPMLTKADGNVTWTDSARAIYDRWRGVLSWPGSRFRHGDQAIRVDALRIETRDTDSGATPGTVLRVDDALEVATGQGTVTLLEVTPPGKRTMPAGAWARGAHLNVEDRLA